MITDGTSNTAAFSERVKAIGNNFTGTTAPFDGADANGLARRRRRPSPTTWKRRPRPTTRSAGDPARTPSQRNQDCGQLQRRQHLRSDVGLGPAGLHAVRPRHAAEHLELPIRVSRSPTWPTATIPEA